MRYKICPRCGFQNVSSSAHCYHCEHKFPRQLVPALFKYRMLMLVGGLFIAWLLMLITGQLN